MTSDLPSWVAIVPVKSFARAKSRLGRDDLTWPFLQDAVAALKHTPSVRAIAIATSDPQVRQWATDVGCDVVSDVGHDGINAAIGHAADSVRLTYGPDQPLFAMVSDLPCLTPAAVEALLTAAMNFDTSFLADADGTGTTSWCTRSPRPVTTHFGLASREAHAASGAIDLVDTSVARQREALAPARRDVDTVDDLAQALTLGVGPATLAALART